MRNQNNNLNRKILTLGILIIAGLTAAAALDIQNPWTLEGWYQCARTDGYPVTSAENTYLVIEDGLYAVVETDNGETRTLQLGTYEKAGSKNTRAAKYELKTNSWDSAEIVHRRLPGTVFMTILYDGSGRSCVEFVKTGTVPDIPVPVPETGN